MNHRDAVFLAAALTLSGHASAQFNGPRTDWTGGTGNWFDTAKWTNGRPGAFRPPPFSDNLFYDLTSWTGPYYSHQHVVIDSGTATLLPAVTTVYNVTGVPDDRYSISYPVTLISLPYTDLGVGGAAGISILGGIRLAVSELHMATGTGSSATVDVTGPPSGANTRNFDVSGAFNVAEAGTGRVNVTGGAVMEYWDNLGIFASPGGTVHKNLWSPVFGQLPGSNGFVKVSGASSKMYFTIDGFGLDEMEGSVGLQIGRGGVGGMTVESSGTLLSRVSRLGVLAGSEGYGTVTGAGSVWDNNAQLYIGESGLGSMLVSSGGLLKSGYGDFYAGSSISVDDPDEDAEDYGSIGRYAGSNGSVTVSGTNSRWENNANVIVGEGGIGNLAIESGGTVVSGYRATGPTALYEDVPDATIGLLGGSNGAVTVRGANAHWQNSSPITIGAAGTGKLTVGSGGTVDAPAGSTIRLGTSGSGTLVFGGDQSAGVGTLGGDTVSGGTGTSLVQFTHNQTYTPSHQFQNIGTLENNGPGTTILNGKISNIGNLRATKGTIVLNSTAGTPTINSLTINGGNLSLAGGLNLTLASGTLLDGAVLNGNLTLSGGTKLTGALGISGASSATAIVTVDGAGSRFTPRKPPLSNNFVVGDGGSGQLILKAGGTVPVDPATLAMTVGYGTGSSGYVEVTGLTSQVTAGTTTIGRAGTGFVRLQTFGNFTTDNGLLGDLAGSHGSVDILGNGSWQVAQNSFTLGNAGAGRIDLSTGGSLRVGPTGSGVITMGAVSGGSGVIQIGKGAAPGSLYASSITGGAAGYGIVQFYHDSPNYTFPVAMNKVLIKVLDGNTGTTALTSDVNCGSIDITTGGLKISGDGHIHVVDGTLTIGDISPEDPGGDHVDPFMIIDGNEVTVDADAFEVGGEATGELWLKNSSITTVGRYPSYSEMALNGTVIFGGDGDACGDLIAAGIRGIAASDKVIFDHPEANFSSNVPLLGPLSVQHKNTGTTTLTGANAYTGPTTITGGNLILPNGLANSTITVSGTGAVGGAGILSRVTLENGAAISPGGATNATAIGNQRVGILTLRAGAKLRIDLGPNLTCDTILNHTELGIYVDTALNFPATGNVIFDFRYRGINQSGVYPVLTPYTALTTDQLNRLTFTSDFPLQGHFQQTRVGVSFSAHYQVEFVVTGFSSPAYDRWVAQNQLDPATTGLPGEDPDHDGRKNMVEFLLGSSPVSGLSSRTPAMTRSGSTATFKFNRRLYSETLFTPTVQYSTNLSTWADATSGMLTSGASGLDDFETVTATIPIPAGSTKFFTRLKVSTVTP